MELEEGAVGWEVLFLTLCLCARQSCIHTALGLLSMFLLLA